MRQPVRLVFIVIALLIVGMSVYYSNVLVKQMTEVERNRIEIWAEATKRMISDDTSDNLDYIFKIIEDNKNIPVVLLDEHNNVLQSRNIKEPAQNKTEFYAKFVASLKANRPPMIINIGTEKQFVYYDDSLLIKQLQYFPFVQLGVIFVFLLVAFFAFASSKKSEQNKVWVGLSKETAHQLGTPISSLLAWTDLLRAKYADDKLIAEMSKDVNRLTIIAERFSKIGSTPDLQPANLNETLLNAIQYMQKRSSAKVEIRSKFEATEQPVFVALNLPLFEWVIENLCKNAIDAMDGVGNIEISTHSTAKSVMIDIEDDGKGMERKMFKQVFKPGFTTKKRGWGLGLSLAKRIIEQYHHGKIFVKSSEQNAGTIFRIVLDTSETSKRGDK
jgi:signal transduction histidine kinase